MRSTLHVDPSLSGNMARVHDGPDHLGHRFRHGKCLDCLVELRHVHQDKRCGEPHYYPRPTTWCPFCSRPLEPDGCPCRDINGIAP